MSLGDVQQSLKQLVTTLKSSTSEMSSILLAWEDILQKLASYQKLCETNPHTPTLLSREEILCLLDMYYVETWQAKRIDSSLCQSEPFSQLDSYVYLLTNKLSDNGGYSKVEAQRDIFSAWSYHKLYQHKNDESWYFLTHANTLHKSLSEQALPSLTRQWTVLEAITQTEYVFGYLQQIGYKVLDNSLHALKHFVHCMITAEKYQWKVNDYQLFYQRYRDVLQKVLVELKPGLAILMTRIGLLDLEYPEPKPRYEHNRLSIDVTESEFLQTIFLGLKAYMYLLVKRSGDGFVTRLELDSIKSWLVNLQKNSYFRCALTATLFVTTEVNYDHCFAQLEQQRIDAHWCYIITPQELVIIHRVDSQIFKYQRTCTVDAILSEILVSATPGWHLPFPIAQRLALHRATSLQYTLPLMTRTLQYICDVNEQHDRLCFEENQQPLLLDINDFVYQRFTMQQSNSQHILQLARDCLFNFVLKEKSSLIDCFNEIQLYSESVAKLLRELISRLATLLPEYVPPLIDICVKGSGARGDLHATSDLDCFVIVENENDRQGPYVQALLRLFKLGLIALGERWDFAPGEHIPRGLGIDSDDGRKLFLPTVSFGEASNEISVIVPPSSIQTARGMIEYVGLLSITTSVNHLDKTVSSAIMQHRTGPDIPDNHYRHFTAEAFGLLHSRSLYGTGLCWTNYIEGLRQDPRISPVIMGHECGKHALKTLLAITPHSEIKVAIQSLTLVLQSTFYRQGEHFDKVPKFSVSDWCDALKTSWAPAITAIIVHFLGYLHRERLRLQAKGHSSFTMSELPESVETLWQQMKLHVLVPLKHNWGKWGAEPPEPLIYTVIKSLLIRYDGKNNDIINRQWHCFNDFVSTLITLEVKVSVYHDIYKNLLSWSQTNETHSLSAPYRHRKLWALFYKVCDYHAAELPSQLLPLLAETADSWGFRLSETIGITDFENQLVLMQTDEQQIVTIGRNGWNATLHYMDDETQLKKALLSQSVTQALLTQETGNVKDDKPRKSQTAYCDRHVNHLENTLINAYVKQHPDFFLMPGAIYAFGQRLCGHGAPPAKFGILELSSQTSNARAPLSYPVLLSPTVPGDTLQKILSEGRLHEYPLDPRYLSDVFILELLKGPADGFARNYIVTPCTDNEGYYRIVCIDNEQMFVNGFGSANKKADLAERSIVYCLPEFQSNGQLSKQGLHLDTLKSFANLDIDKVLYQWLSDLIELNASNKALLEYTSDLPGSTLLQRIQENEYPFFAELRFPEGCIGLIAMKLRIIQGLCQRALTDNTPLLPQTLMTVCQGSTVCNLYYREGLPSNPLERLARINGMPASAGNFMETSCSRDYTRLGFGGSGLDIEGRGLTPEVAINEIGRYKYDIVTELGGAAHVITPYVNMTTEGYSYRHITFWSDIEGIKTPMSEVQQARHLRSLIHMRYAFTVLSLDGCSALLNNCLAHLLLHSKDSLRVLCLRDCSGLTDKDIQLLTEFSVLEVLMLNNTPISTIGSWGKNFVRQEVAQPLIFRKLEVLYLHGAENLTQICLVAPRLKKLTIKNTPRVSRVELMQGKQVAHGSNLQMVLIKKAPSLNTLKIDRPYYYNCHVEGVAENYQQYLGDKCTLPRGETVLHWAVSQNLWSVVRQCVKQGQINQKNSHGEPALLSAFKSGNIEAVKRLISAGADLSNTDAQGNTLLSLAISTKNLTLIQYLVEKKIVVLNGKNSNHLLTLGIKTRDPLLIRYLLQHGVMAKEDVEPYLNKALTSSGRAGNLSDIKLWIECGAHLKAKEDDNNTVYLDDESDEAEDIYTALHWAAQIGNKPIIDYFIEQGVSLELATGKGKWTPLLLTTAIGNLKSVQYLIEKGANVYACLRVPYLEIDNDSLLHIAASYGHLHIVQYLVKHKVLSKPAGDADKRVFVMFGVAERIQKNISPIDILNIDGKTPLLSAAQSGHWDIVKYLLSKGANINTKDYGGVNALSYAIKEKNLIIVKYLFEYNASVNYESELRLNDEILNYSIRYTSIEIIDYLVSKSSQLRDLIKSQKSPLFLLAVSWRNKAFADFFLRHGALVDQKDEHGETALIKAVKNCDIDMIKFVLNNGANINMTDNIGRTPFMHIVSLSYIKILEGYSEIHQDEIKHKWYEQPYLELSKEQKQCAVDDYASILKFLSSQHIDLEKKSDNGYTILLWAVKSSCYFSIIEGLIEKGADICAVDNQGRNALMITNGYVAELYETGKFDINAVDNNGRTALMAQINSWKSISYLIDQGADPYITDSDGNNLLMIASIFNVHDKKEMLSYLIHELKIKINSKNSHGQSALMIMLNNHYLYFEWVLCLIENGASCIDIDNDNRTILHHVMLAGIKSCHTTTSIFWQEKEAKEKCNDYFLMEANPYHFKIVKFLVEKLKDSGDFLDFLNRKDNLGDSALALAISNDWKDIAEYLIEQGAINNKVSNKKLVTTYEIVNKKINYDNNLGNTPLMVAITAGHKYFDTVKSLAAKSESLELKNIYGETALMVAVKNANFDALQYLIFKGAKIDAINKQGLTVLMQAVVMGPIYLPIIEYLVEKGANLELQNPNDETALALAKKLGYEVIVKYLQTSAQQKIEPMSYSLFNISEKTTKISARLTKFDTCHNFFPPQKPVEECLATLNDDEVFELHGGNTEGINYWHQQIVLLEKLSHDELLSDCALQDLKAHFNNMKGHVDSVKANENPPTYSVALSQLVTKALNIIQEAGNVISVQPN